MKKLFLLLLFCHVSSAAMHSLKFFVTASSGVPNFPELVAVGLVDETPAGYCDTNKKILELKQDWVKKINEINPQHFEWYSRKCFELEPNFSQNMINNLKQRFNQSEGVHIFQEMYGCEWDDETGEVTGYMQYGYNGEDLMSFDVKTETWIASKQEAIMKKDIWNADRPRAKYKKNYLSQICPERLKTYLAFGNSSLMRTDLPSVSLLQKTSSSSVSCHASGFYPERSSLFWRKDGEEIHEDVDHGEILPNHDGTFQMSVDLDLSSVTPEDWRRYECVFQLSGVKDDIVTRLDKDVIRTNEAKRPPPSDTSSEHSAKLNPESSSIGSTQSLNPESSSIGSTQSLNSESYSIGSSRKLIQSPEDQTHHPEHNLCVPARPGDKLDSSTAHWV